MTPEQKRQAWLTARDHLQRALVGLWKADEGPSTQADLLRLIDRADLQAKLREPIEENK